MTRLRWSTDRQERTARPAVGRRAAAWRSPGRWSPSRPAPGRRADRQPRLHDRDRSRGARRTCVERGQMTSRNSRRGAAPTPRVLRPDGRLREEIQRAGGPTTRTSLIARLAQLGLDPMGGLSSRPVEPRCPPASVTPDRGRHRPLSCRPLCRAGDECRHRQRDRSGRSSTCSGGPIFASRASPSAGCRSPGSRPSPTHRGRGRDPDPRTPDVPQRRRDRPAVQRPAPRR